ncbi:hypothetical protein [Clostridium felsineum]|uniref:hypothetical protein n=1 Tax=Clostridium felsineum TaxID=36839 RepID=UPI001FA8306A|nr:hypothetical protein [Clostridium felsineum]
MAKYDINPVQLSYWKNCHLKFSKKLKPKEPKELDKPIPNYKKEYDLILKIKENLELKNAILKDMLKKYKNKFVHYSQ